MNQKKKIIPDEEFGKIEKLFSVKIQQTADSYSIIIRNAKVNSDISVEVFPGENEYLVSVYTSNAHLQLQSCTGFIISEMLEEIIFFSETESKISGLIISKQGDCALYSNVDKKILSSDFSDLSSEKLLAAVALSVTESVE